MLDPQEGHRILRLWVPPPRSPHVLTGEMVDIGAHVEVRAVDECRVTISYDHAIFELLRGSIETDLGGGSYTRQLDWLLRALKPTQVEGFPASPAWVTISATADGLIQTSTSGITVHASKEMMSYE